MGFTWVGNEGSGTPRGWNEIVRDPRGNLALFNVYGASSTEICFQTVEGCLL